MPNHPCWFPRSTESLLAGHFQRVFSTVSTHSRIQFRGSVADDEHWALPFYIDNECFSLDLLKSLFSDFSGGLSHCLVHSLLHAERVSPLARGVVVDALK